MNKLLVILGFSANDAIQAEKLLDLCALYHNKQPKGDLLLVAAPDLHGESKTKCKIAAEVAFENVELLEVGWPAVAHTTKYEAVNHLFLAGMTHATRCYQSPVLWLEPDAIPLRPVWLLELTHAYFDQPKRYMGAGLASQDGKQRHLSRVAIYPRGAGGELKEFCAGKTPFEISAGSIIVPRAGKSKLFQQLAYTSTTERSSVRDNAVLLHSDKAGVLLSSMMEEAQTAIESEKALPTAAAGEANQIHATPIESPTAYEEPSLPKLDGRTKAGKAAKAGIDPCLNKPT